MSGLREGQVIGHVFVFLIGAFVMAAIMLLGWRAITTMQDQQCQATEASFVSELQKAIQENLARGKTRTRQIQLPCNADQICFVARKVVDNTGGAYDAERAAIQNSHPAIGASIVSGDQSNVFLRKGGTYEPATGFSNAAPIAMPAGSGSDGITCIDGDTVELVLQGTGQEVGISTP